MPRIFDSIALDLLPALRETLQISERSDFCVGYFNLRGWKSIDELIEKWPGGTGQQCRLLVGMQRLPQDELREAYSLLPADGVERLLRLCVPQDDAEAREPNIICSLGIALSLTTL